MIIDSGLPLVDRWEVLRAEHYKELMCLGQDFGSLFLFDPH